MTGQTASARAATPEGATGTGRLAVVGTSHVGCVKAALSNSPRLASRWQDIFFMAVNAPMLSKQNALGWPENDGTLSFNIPEARAFLGRMFGNPGLRFSPAEYDVVLLVDFFFCYDFSYQICDNTAGPRRISGVPASAALFEEVLRHRLGRSWYGPSGPIGEIPENSTIPLLNLMKRMAPATRFLLTGRPAHPVANKSVMGLTMDDQLMASGMQIFEKVAQETLSESGIHLVRRSQAQSCPETGLTPDRYSVGPHPRHAKGLDEHTNAEYGALLLQQVESMLTDIQENQ